MRRMLADRLPEKIDGIPAVEFRVHRVRVIGKNIAETPQPQPETFHRRQRVGKRSPDDFRFGIRFADHGRGTAHQFQILPGRRFARSPELPVVGLVPDLEMRNASAIAVHNRTDKLLPRFDSRLPVADRRTADCRGVFRIRGIKPVAESKSQPRTNPDLAETVDHAVEPCKIIFAGLLFTTEPPALAARPFNARRRQKLIAGLRIEKLPVQSLKTDAQACRGRFCRIDRSQPPHLH